MKKLIKYTAVITGIIIAVILIVRGVKYLVNRQKILLLSDSTIQCDLDSEKNLLGKLMVEEEFSADNTKYYEITTSITDFYAYTFPEAEFNKLFGNNDAFYTDRYTLDISSVISYAPIFFLPGYKYLPKELFCKAKDSDGKMYILGYVEIRSGDKVYGHIKKERFSGFGEKDFTNEEIEQYKEDLKNMAEDFLRLNNNESTTYHWGEVFHISDEYRALYQPDKLWQKKVKKAS